MTIRICKITKLLWGKGDLYMFSAFSGEHFTIVYIGDNPPKPLKTVDYQVSGVMTVDRQKRKQMEITSYKKVGKIKIYKAENQFDL